MKRKWLWILVWFAVLLSWNIISNWTLDYPKYEVLQTSGIAVKNALVPDLPSLMFYKILAGIGEMTTPLEIALSIMTILLIIKPTSFRKL